MLLLYSIFETILPLTGIRSCDSISIFTAKKSLFISEETSLSVNTSLCIRLHTTHHSASRKTITFFSSACLIASAYDIQFTPFSSVGCAFTSYTNGNARIKNMIITTCLQKIIKLFIISFFSIVYRFPKVEARFQFFQAKKERRIDDIACCRLCSNHIPVEWDLSGCLKRKPVR